MKTKVYRLHRKWLLAWAMIVIRIAVIIAPFTGQAVGSWIAITNFPFTRPSHMLLLSDGTVMVEKYGGNAWYRLAPDEQGHYLNGIWSTNLAMHETRLFFASDVLQDGRV